MTLSEWVSECVCVAISYDKISQLKHTPPGMPATSRDPASVRERRQKERETCVARATGRVAEAAMSDFLFMSMAHSRPTSVNRELFLETNVTKFGYSPSFLASVVLFVPLFCVRPSVCLFSPDKAFSSWTRLCAFPRQNYVMKSVVEQHCRFSFCGNVPRR